MFYECSIIISHFFLQKRLYSASAKPNTQQLSPAGVQVNLCLLVFRYFSLLIHFTVSFSLQYFNLHQPVCCLYRMNVSLSYALPPNLANRFNGYVQFSRNSVIRFIQILWAYWHTYFIILMAGWKSQQWHQGGCGRNWLTNSSSRLRCEGGFALRRCVSTRHHSHSALHHWPDTERG